MKRTISLAVAGIAAAAFALTACADTDGAPSDTRADHSSVGDGAEKGANALSPSEPEAEPATEEPAEPAFARWGQAFTYEDGIELSVSKPQAFTPNQWAAGGEAYDTHITFDVTITNGTDAPYDPSMAIVYATGGGVDGEEVFDSEQGMDGSPMARILPGQSVTWTTGFGVGGLDNIAVQVEPDWDHEAAIFAGPQS